jgi:signal transduction histidine kinase
LRPNLNYSSEVYRSPTTLVRRGCLDGVPIVVKSPVGTLGSDVLARYRREYALLEKTSGPGVAEILHLFDEERPELVFRDRGGRSLAAEPMPLRRSISIFKAIASTLIRLHSLGVVHKQVTPSHILLTPNAKVELIDFSIASTLSREHSGVMEGDLRYLAPEQTGRLGWAVDLRSDLYSLGATFWHLLVGRAPFGDIDPRELMHAKMTRKPTSPSTLLDEIPDNLGQVVLTLMARQPEHRYQSAKALLNDLESIDRPDFHPRRTVDGKAITVSSRFRGRESELGALSELIRSSRLGGNSMAVVVGPPGVGKTALVAQCEDLIRRLGGALGRGVSDLDVDRPYSALTMAIQEVLSRIVGLPEQEWQDWLRHLQQKLEPCTAVLLDILPDLNLFIPTPASRTSKVEGARDRVHLALATLMSALSARIKPLVLFLDDWNTADKASLDVVRFLVQDSSIQGLLVLMASGSFRSTEGWNPKLISLEGLEFSEVESLVRDSLKAQSDQVESFVEALVGVSNGNPAQLHGMLNQLEEHGFFEQQPWDLDKLKIVSEDSVPTLPEATVSILSSASVLGKRFGLPDLEALTGKPVTEISRLLWPALEDCLILPSGESYRLVDYGCPVAKYRFASDSIRQHFRDLLDPHVVLELHLRLGEHYKGLNKTAGAVRHLTLALPLMREEQRTEFAGLALERAHQLSRLGLYDQARTLFRTARGMATEDASVFLQLGIGEIRAALTGGQLQGLDAIFLELGPHTKCTVTRVQLMILEVKWLIALDRAKEALDRSDKLLEELGYNPPRRFSPTRFVKELVAVRKLLAGRSPSQLEALSYTSDPLVCAVQELQSLQGGLHGTICPERVPLGVLRDCRAVLEDGLTTPGAQCWTGYGLLLCLIGRVEQGMAFARLAVRQSEADSHTSFWTRVSFFAHLLVDPWGTPLSTVESRLEGTYRRGMALGESSFALHALAIAHFFAIFSGKNLQTVRQDLRSYRRVADQYNHSHSRSIFQMVEGQLSHLIGDGPQPEDSLSDVLGGAIEHLLKLRSNLVRGDFPSALSQALSTPEFFSKPTAGAFHFLYWTYAGVALQQGVNLGIISRFRVAPRLAQARYYLKRWSVQAPFRSWRLRWLKTLAKNDISSLGALEQLIEEARAAGYVQDAALMAEQAASVSARCSLDSLATVYQNQAKALYKRWGAALKSSSGDFPEDTDRAILIQAGKTLSTEATFSNVLCALLSLARDKVGAESAWVVDCREPWTVLAQAKAGEEARLVSLPVERSSLPVNVLRQVADTLQPLVCCGVDPKGEKIPLSMVCLPLVRGSSLVGFLLFESDLKEGVFGPHRVETLEILAAQLAVTMSSDQQVRDIEQHYETILAERQRRQLEEVRREAVEARNDSLAGFLGIASHDLKTPLASIALWARELRDGQIETSTAGLRIEKACRRAGNLVSNYLDGVAAEGGNVIPLSLEPCQLDLVVEREIDFLLDSLPPEMREETALEWELEQVELVGDTQKLGQVVANLVGNALRYCDRGTAITVELSSVENQASLKVTDEGPGLPSDLEGACFDPFRRGSGKQGSGLGLWVSKLIVEAHGGVLEHLPRKTGTQFSVLLPLNRSDLKTGHKAKANCSTLGEGSAL